MFWNGLILIKFIMQILDLFQKKTTIKTKTSPKAQIQTFGHTMVPVRKPELIPDRNSYSAKIY